MDSLFYIHGYIFKHTHCRYGPFNMQDLFQYNYFSNLQKNLIMK